MLWCFTAGVAFIAHDTQALWVLPFDGHLESITVHELGEMGEEGGEAWEGREGKDEGGLKEHLGMRGGGQRATRV